MRLSSWRFWIHYKQGFTWWGQEKFLMGPWRREIAIKYNTLQYYLSGSSGDTNSVQPTDHFATPSRVWTWDWDILHWTWDFSFWCPVILYFKMTGGLWLGQSGASVWSQPDYWSSPPLISYLLYIENTANTSRQNRPIIYLTSLIFSMKKSIYTSTDTPYNINTSKKSFSMVFSVTCLGHFIWKVKKRILYIWERHLK